jgi:hypothetical protein
MPRYIDADVLWRDITSNIEYCGDVLEIIERQPVVTINDIADENKVTNCNHNAEVGKMVSSACGHENGKDVIYRQDAKDRLTILVNEIESIFADIRERNVDDSVCGLCEYDCDHGIDGSAFECLGFERDDCFKLKDEYRKEWTDVSALPSAQPELIEKAAYIRGFEQGRTQGMIDSQMGKK